MLTNHTKLTAVSVIGITRIVRQKLQNYHIFTNNGVLRRTYKFDDFLFFICFGFIKLD
jgi:hypothetical protein